MKGIRQLNLDEDAVELTDCISKTGVLITCQSKLKNPRIQAAMHSDDLPIYAINVSSTYSLFLSGSSHLLFEYQQWSFLLLK